MIDQSLYDEERIRSENLKELLYKYEKDGTYSHHVGYDYLKPEELLMHDMLKMMKEKLEGIRQKVLAGKLSPICYYMEKTNMEPGLLSQFVGFSSRKVKRHFNPEVFRRLNPEILKKYADAFEISVDELSSMGSSVTI